MHRQIQSAGVGANAFSRKQERCATKNIASENVDEPMRHPKGVKSDRNRETKAAILPVVRNGGHAMEPSQHQD